MTNKYYTLMIVPENTSHVHRIIIPRWVLRGAAVGVGLLVLLASVMVFDYWYVMSQVGENKQLRIENRKLRQQVQIFQNKMNSVENTMERIRTFITRLKVIMHIEEHGPPHLEGKALPDASTNIHKTAFDDTSINREEEISSLDPEKLELQKEYDTLDSKIVNMTQQALQTEQTLQDQYEILSDKKDFLAALPSRQPAIGYFTSGFGVRQSPYGNRYKMHEGLDIANRPGTVIRAPANGEVIFTGSKPGYGVTVVLDHGYGMQTWYGHLKRFIVHKGEKIRRGAKIALLGNSGRSTGPHVHYEVRVRGYPVDPLSYIIEDPSP